MHSEKAEGRFDPFADLAMQGWTLMWRQRGLQLSEFEGVVDFRVVGALKTPVAELWDDDQPDEESDDPEYGRFAAKLRDAGLTARRERAGHLSRASRAVPLLEWPRCCYGVAAQRRLLFSGMFQAREPCAVTAHPDTAKLNTASLEWVEWVNPAPAIS